MDKSELERLAAILGNKENGYRSSPVTEATELREIIRNARPDLYELMIAEKRGEQDIKFTITPPSLSKKDESESYIAPMQDSYDNYGSE